MMVGGTFISIWGIIAGVIMMGIPTVIFFAVIIHELWYDWWCVR